MPVEENPQDAMEDLMKGERSPGKGMKVKTTHTVVEGDTLSALALKYYGSAAKEKWMAIFNANRGTIGNNPNVIKPGMELRIPEVE